MVLILDSCYSGAFLEDMGAQLRSQNGRIAVLTAASDTRATYYNVKDTGRAVDFFTFFLLQGLGNLLARRTFNRTLFNRRHRKQEGTV